MRQEGRGTKTVSAVPGLVPRQQQYEGHFQEHERGRGHKGRHGAWAQPTGGEPSGWRPQPTSGEQSGSWAQPTGRELSGWRPQPSRTGQEQPSWSYPTGTSGASSWESATPSSQFGIPVTRILPQQQRPFGQGPHHPQGLPGQQQQQFQRSPTLVGELDTRIRRIADQEIEQHRHQNMPGHGQTMGQQFAQETSIQYAQKEALHKLALEKQHVQQQFQDQAKQLHALQQIEDERARVRKEEEDARRREQERAKSMAQEIAQRAQRKVEDLAEQAKRQAEQTAQELIQQARQKAQQQAQKQAAIETQQMIDSERQRIQDEAQRKGREETERIKAAAEEAIKHQLRHAEDANRKKQEDAARRAAEIAAKKAAPWKPGKYFDLAKEKLSKKIAKK